MKVKWGSSNFTKIETPPQVASKNFPKIKICLSVYIYLNSRLAAPKISNKSQGIRAILSNP